MVIALTRSEKSALVRFLGFYLASSFVLLSIIAWLFYKVESNLYFDLITSNMKTVSSKISSTIVYAHMTNQKISPKKIHDNIQYDFALYDEDRKLLVGNISEKIDFEKKINFVNGNIILVDPSSRGHLGVSYVVIKENIYKQNIEKLVEKIVISFLLIFALLFFVGLYLAKMFIKPIISERIKLNNFIKDTTHELNTPITAILMCTSESSSLSPRNLQRINISAKRISEIYKDLIYLFLEDKRKEEPENLQLDTIILEQIEYFKTLASKKRVKISTHLEATSHFIDKESFIRLVNNLISNAIKYNKIDGHIKITLEKGIFTIKDNGIGINKDDLKDIFKRFYRANSVQGGFGIGLNIVATICKEYNIKVDVDSNLNVGTTFKLDFTSTQSPH